MNFGKGKDVNLTRTIKFIRESYIDFIVESKIAQVGNFKLKSGKQSNVFFDFGKIDNGEDLAILGMYFAKYINYNLSDIDVVYGPAYKGINLALATSIALSELKNTKVPFLYDRKETKTHGETGNWIGKWEPGYRAVIVDDVITTCATKYEAVDKLKKIGVLPVAVVTGLDREEFNEESGLSYTHDFSDATGISIFSLCKKSDVFK